MSEETRDAWKGLGALLALTIGAPVVLYLAGIVLGLVARLIFGGMDVGYGLLQ